MSNDEILAALAAPFDASELKYKPAMVKGNRALALHYVDARVIQDRLDEVLGVAGWQDEYECLPDGTVVCRLRCRIGEEWIQKVDVGGESEQQDGGDRRKAAFSDSLKRAAVKFGIGRYLYRLPSQWLNYDPVKKQFLSQPTLPATTPKTRPVANGTKQPPTDGAELLLQLQRGEAAMVKRRWCQEGELLAHLQKTGIRRKYPAKIGEWTGEALTWALEEAGRFKAARKAAAEPVAAEGLVSRKTLAALRAHVLELGLDAEDQAALLSQYETQCGADLTEAQATELLKDLGARVAAKYEQERQHAEAQGIL